ncbi:MAG: TonB-dependent receptor [Bacteroidia bacterium]|nr:TonB-dependent receptor [Bacteroidia bacterium]
MKSCYTLFCLLTSLWMGVYAQTGSIRGKVYDRDNTPSPYTHVALEGTTLQCLTDAQGTFGLDKLAPGDYTLLIVAGARTLTQPCTVAAGQVTDLVIVLEQGLYEMPNVNILGKSSRLLRDLPGSAGYVSTHELDLLAPVSGNEALRRVPGVHVVDEEGAGLRVNIGLRGLDPDRSRNVLILEDGVPVALNPYGEPEMYYTPSIDRMSGVEVLKGSGQILYGPQTIGGVINYVTADPPQEATAQVRLQGGQGGYLTGLASYGNTFGQAGIQVNYLRRQADNLGPTDFTLNDLSGKLKLVLGEKAVLSLKLGVYDEQSNSTYIGLTQPMYEAGGLDYVRLAPFDRLAVRRYSLSATHAYHFSPRLVLRTTAFGYTTTRNWRRQDFSGSATASNQTGVVWGDPAIPGGAIYMRNSTGNRNRQFEVAGVESRLTWTYQLGQMSGELTAGGRYLYERAYEQRINGTKPDAGSGSLVEDEIRTGAALSAFVQQKLELTPNLVLTAGLRAERYAYERDILRRMYGASVRDTSVVATSEVAALIPGLGLNYNITRSVSLFGGVHRGFAPPRIKDAISNQGEPYQLNAEQSLNYELGTRALLTQGLYLEVTGFVMDFANQIIPVSESSGGQGSGLVNGGRTMHRGVEAAAVLALGEMLGWQIKLDFDLNATLQQAFFSGDRFQTSGSEQINLNGNRTPYAPQTLLSGALALELPSGLALRLTSTYVGDQYTDPLNTVLPSADGQTGRLAAYGLLDGTLQYTVTRLKTTFLLSGKNLTDARYISTRRPQGIRVGMPRFITAGFSVAF